MAPPPCCPGSLPALMEELVEEILLRIPPDEPAHLFRAVLVCKAWCRILTDPDFLRRYRAFYGAPPLLGYFHNLDDLFENNQIWIPPLLAPTTAASSPLTQPDLKCSCLAVDCRHGRVVLTLSFMTEPEYLVVWDPITGDHKKLSLPAGTGYSTYDTGAVLCAVDGCDHLDCHAGPFLVVVAGPDFISYCKTWVAIYSSETGVWSSRISIRGNCVLKPKPPLLIRDTLYFSSDSHDQDDHFGDILKFDLGRLGARQLSLIAPPVGLGHEDVAIAMEVDGGELGFVSVKDNCIYMWSWQRDTNSGICGWANCKVVDQLGTLFSTGRHPFCSYKIVGLLERTNTIFISLSSVGLFALDLKSRKVKKVGKERPYAIIPYTSFYTPDLAKGTYLHRLEDAMIDTRT